MIRVDGVSKAYGAVQALQHVSLELPQGAIGVLRGPSGSGKTTLLRLIAGLDFPDEGRIVLAGRVSSAPGWGEAPYRRGVGMVFQDDVLWPHLTVAQNVTFGLLGQWPRRARRQRVAALLARLEIADLARRYPAQLSGGQARRVALARALAPRPKILLLDEPLVHLDDELQSRVLAVILAEVAEAGTTLLIVAHSAMTLELVADRQWELRDGILGT